VKTQFDQSVAAATSVDLDQWPVEFGERAARPGDHELSL
jgi:hypothetical protein